MSDTQERPLASLEELQREHARVAKALWSTNDHFLFPGMMSTRAARWASSDTRSKLVALVGLPAVAAVESAA